MHSHFQRQAINRWFQRLQFDQNNLIQAPLASPESPWQHLNLWIYRMQKLSFFKRKRDFKNALHNRCKSIGNWKKKKKRFDGFAPLSANCFYRFSDRTMNISSWISHFIRWHFTAYSIPLWSFIWLGKKRQKQTHQMRDDDANIIDSTRKCKCRWKK